MRKNIIKLLLLAILVSAVGVSTSSACAGDICQSIIDYMTPRGETVESAECDLSGGDGCVSIYTEEGTSIEQCYEDGRPVRQG